MLILLLSFCGLSLASALVFMSWMKAAPFAKETEERGFEIVWCNERAETPDVSCVWVVCPA